MSRLAALKITHNREDHDNGPYRLAPAVTTCGLYLNDPTAWIRPPTNLRARPPRHRVWRLVTQLGAVAGGARGGRLARARQHRADGRDRRKPCYLARRAWP
jgi:hypothetical protein